MSPRKKQKVTKRKNLKPSAARLAAFEKKFQLHFEKMGQALQAYERDHPNWQHECLFWIMESSLRRLKQCLESKKEPRFTWMSPYAELKFPVECRWFKKEGEKTFTVNSGNVTEKDLSSKAAVLKSMTRLMVRQIEISTLQTVTNYAAYAQEKGRYTPMLGQDSLDYLRSLKSDRARGEAIRSVLQPCSFGAATIQLPDSMQPGDTIPKSAAIQLSKMRPPLLSVPCEINGLGPVEVIVLFEVHPLVVNFAKREAHYPLIVGLSLLPAPGSSARLVKPPWEYLNSLDAKARRSLWTSLFEASAARMAEIWPKKQPLVEEAIFHVNLRIRLRTGEAVSLSDLPDETLRQLAVKGEIVEFEIRSDSPGFRPLGPEFSSLLSEVEQAKTSEAKGKTLEALMVSLFSTIAGFHIEPRTRTKTEEIDLFIENGSDEPGLRSEGNIILVECKNWSKKCGKDDFVLFQQKMINRRGRCSIGFLVSWKGFARTIPLEMLRSSHEQALVVPLDGQQITAAIEKGNFLECLLQARRNALKA